MLNKIKLLLGLTDTSKDELLLALIERACDEVRNYCHISDIACASNVISDMVIYQYNRLGSEGLNSENYSGVSFNYTNDYPDSIIRQLKAHRKVRTICSID